MYPRLCHRGFGSDGSISDKRVSLVHKPIAVLRRVSFEGPPCPEAVFAYLSFVPSLTIRTWK